MVIIGNGYNDSTDQQLITVIVGFNGFIDSANGGHNGYSGDKIRLQPLYYNHVWLSVNDYTIKVTKGNGYNGRCSTKILKKSNGTLMV